MAKEPIIHLQNVSKGYGPHAVLQNFNLKIYAGEFIAAIGSSGSGKTTALKLINGLLQPDAGTVFIKGQNIALLDQNQLRRNIGYTVQGAGLFPHMKIKDNIAYVMALKKAGKAEIKRSIAELADLTRLDRGLLDRYPHELSGGQRQRVGLARALAAKPDIVLMDEPLGAVDDIVRKELQKEIKRIHQHTNATVFFITHDIAEALFLGTRILVMDQGVIHQFAEPDEIKQRPATEFAAKLIGGA